MDKITVSEVSEPGGSGWFNIFDEDGIEYGSKVDSWKGKRFPEEGMTIEGRLVDKGDRKMFFGDASQGGGGGGYTGPRKAAGGGGGSKWQPPTMATEKIKFVSFATSYSKDLTVALIAAGILGKSEDIGNALKYFAHQIHETMIEIADSQQ